MTPPAPQRPAITIACGGTGGHLFPGLAVAEQCLARHCTVRLLISPKEVDQHGVRQARGTEVQTLPAVAFQRGHRIAALRGFVQSWSSCRQLFNTRRPDAVLGMGGFTSAPPLLAARSRRVKTFLHESNTVPGRANRCLSPYVDQVFLGFPQASSRLRAREMTVTGTPVRTSFHAREAGACKAALGLTPGRPVVLVVGGSQGASALNDLVLATLPKATQRMPNWQWIHLTGPRDEAKVRQAYDALAVQALVRPFLSEMDQALGAASVVVSRAGASSLAEFAAMQVPSVLVPFPFAADNHQWHNARAFADSGAARLLEQKGATADALLQLLLELVEETRVREKARAALKEWHAPKAASQIAEIILNAIGAEATNPLRPGEAASGGALLNLRTVA